MTINVTKDVVSQLATDQVHKGEYNVNTLNFIFSGDYNGISKMAVFSNNYETYEVPITNNTCIIPSEVLSKQGTLTLGVYGYTSNNGVLTKRYSPMPTTVTIKNGSYKRGLNPQATNPTQFEEFVEQLEGDIDDLQSQIDTKQDELTAGDNVTITDGTISSYAPTNVSELTNDAGYITKNVNDLTNYELKTSTGTTVELSINTTTYVMTLNLKNGAGTTISTQSIDLPIETMIVNASYDSTTKEIVLTLQSGETIRVSVADLVSGLQTEITNDNKLSSDLVTDTNHTNKFVTASDKTAWSAKYDKPATRNSVNRFVKCCSVVTCKS